MAIKTYEDMNKRITEILELTGEPMNLYAAQRIKNLERWIRNEGENNNICTYNILGEICVGCGCKRKI
mgnify:CR=1 FL=1